MKSLPVLLLVLLASCGSPPAKQDAPAAAPEEAGIATTVAFTEGPAADAAGNVYFTETTSARIMKYTPGGRAQTFRENSGGANGLVFDSEWRLIACEGAAKRVTRTDMKSGKIEVIAAGFEGKPFNSPNDVTLDNDGRIYFTDPVPPGAHGIPGVYRIDRDGKITRILSGPSIEWPNGITISPDAKTLYLVEANKIENGARQLKAYDLATDGSVSNQRTFYNFYPGRSADGITIDSSGNVYAAAGLMRTRGTHETLDTKPGVYVISPAGKLLSYTPVLEDTITNVAFGGPDLKTLYITAGKTLYQMRTEIAGTRR
jgi:gluconolactonase